MNERWTLAELHAQNLGKVLLFATASVRERAAALFDLEQVTSLEHLPPELETLVVVGGGTAIDAAKLALADREPAVRLVAVPSLWGSGAEVSPVAVRSGSSGKEIRLDARLVPAARVVVPELIDSASDAQVRHACGDAWSHAYEGLLSPLSSAELRMELAQLIGEMLALGVGRDPRWFELSARACDGQARSGVGLIHGIAHTLEGPARAQLPGEPVGHARLCATLCLPVYHFNRSSSGRWAELVAQLGIDADGVRGTFEALHEPALYAALRPLLGAHWRQVLRDPLTRINSALVRPADLAFFDAERFA